MSSAINLAHDAGAVAAIEITKVSAFIGYFERNAPGVGDLAGYTNELTEGVKNQLESTGSCPFVTLFEKVRNLVLFCHLFSSVSLKKTSHMLFFQLWRNKPLCKLMDLQNI